MGFAHLGGHVIRPVDTKVVILPPIMTAFAEFPVVVGPVCLAGGEKLVFWAGTKTSIMTQVNHKSCFNQNKTA